MNDWMIYLAKVSIVFAAFWITYYVLFRRLTFHGINRAFLLLALPLSLIVPVLSLGLDASSGRDVIIPGFDELVTINPRTAIPGQSLSPGTAVLKALLILYLTGLLTGIFRLVLSAFRLWNTMKCSNIRHDDGHFIVSANVPRVFSCFRWIFVPENDPDQCTGMVIEHEKLHVRLGHTIDLIATGVFVALLWFNPFVYFFRRSIRAVHEFQVDSILLKNNVRKPEYLSLLLAGLGSVYRPDSLYNDFHGLTIKNRINMITKNNSSKTQLIRYLLLIPVMAFLAMSFNNPSGEPPELFPVDKAEYSGISMDFGKKFVHPFTRVETIHKGIDIKAGEGVDVLASAGGRVIKISTEKGWGNLVVIDHGDGFESWYAHLKDFTVEFGQQVTKGQTIGHVGNTGYSTGPHLHFEVRLNGKNVDPLDYVDKQ
ncbi:MAG: peptidoglycan DD-metalloendopeptidase family protein [Bacteroidales bacterium]|jgi:hypothetical protein